MKHFFLGVLIGLVAAVIPFSRYKTAPAVFPGWQANIEAPELVEKSPFIKKESSLIPVKKDQNLIVFNIDGSLNKSVQIPPDRLFIPSQNGKYYITYSKVGNSIDLFDLTGQRFWQYKSDQYPLFSYNGKLILLLVADQSAIKFIDINANETGEKKITGRFYTAINTSHTSDAVSIGFLNGSYFFIDGKGNIIYQGETGGKTVKSIALSPGLKYGVVHYGDSKKDYISSVNLKNGDKVVAKLPFTHVTRTAVYINDDGEFSIINREKFIYFDDDGNDYLSVKIPPQASGHSSIQCSGSSYFLSYRLTTGGSQFIILTDKGDLLFKREYKNEMALDLTLHDDLIVAKGTGSLYSWQFRN